MTRPEFADVYRDVTDVEGWLTREQAHVLWERARRLRPGARVVEIGSFRGRSTIVLAVATPAGVEVVAVDPHLGTDRGPQEMVTSDRLGELDHDRFHANLTRAGVDERVHHVRTFSSEALDDVEGPVDLLFVDGAHRFVPARDDLVRWGERVRDGGTMLIHDAFSSIGLTLAMAVSLFFGSRFRYVGRTGSLAEYRRETVGGAVRVTNALRQMAQLPWFARNVLVKILLVARLRPLTRLLGHRSGDWPY